MASPSETVQEIKIKINPSEKNNIKIKGTSPSARLISVGPKPSTVSVSTFSNNYETLTHKPSINGHTLIGNLSSEDLEIAGDKTFFYRQNIASNEWIIIHNLEKYPSVTIIDSAGNEVIGDVRYDNINQVTITFEGEFKGTATLN